MKKTVRQIKIEGYLNDIKRIIPIMKKNIKFDKGMNSGINYLQDKINKIQEVN